MHRVGEELRLARSNGKTRVALVELAVQLIGAAEDECYLVARKGLLDLAVDLACGLPLCCELPL